MAENRVTNGVVETAIVRDSVPGNARATNTVLEVALLKDIVPGVVTRHVGEGRPLDELSSVVLDARVRDSALLAVENLAPSKRQGINTVTIAGKEIGALEAPPLTYAVREEIRRQLKHPVVSKEEVAIIGYVREIDLDAHRFELRHVENMELNDVRCVYSEESDEEAAEWLNKRIRVNGIVDRDQAGKPRLLEVASVEIAQ